MHPEIQRCLLVPRAACFLLCLAVVGRGERIVERTFEYRTTIRTVTFAEEAETITNPLHWPQLKSVVPDGAYVEAGTVITEFDRDGILNLLENLECERAIVRAGLARTLTSIRNRDMALQDELEGLGDRLDVLKTQLKRYLALPEPDDVAIAEGRLRVARLEYEAAKEDLEKAKDRFKRGMISPGELDADEQAFLESEARLAYGAGVLRIASCKARPSLIRRTKLAIANVELEIAKMEDEIARNREISAIERDGANARVEIIENRIAESEQDLTNAVVRAPTEGHVVYLPTFRHYLGATGDKMWKNFAYMRIPNGDTVALKGTLLESERRFFREGDAVLIRVAGHPETPVRGRIASFSALSHDRAEQEEERSRRIADSGIMVYDIVIEPTERPAWLRVGLSAECELIATEPLTAPSVPSTFVKARNGDWYLSFDGTYEKVDGTLVDGHLALDDELLAGREVTMLGQFADESARHATENLTGFRAAAELQPADTEDVIIADIYRWQKVAWIIPEDTAVTQDTVVARIDTADTEEEIKQAETLMRQAVSRREKEEEELQLRAEENRFNLARAKNLCEAAKLDLDDLLDKEETAELLRAVLTEKLAQVRLQFLDRKLERVENTRASAFSPLEIAQLKRDRKRAALQLEAARIKLQKERDDPEQAEVSAAERDYLECRFNVVNLEKKLETDTFRKNYDLRRAQREERRRREELDERYLEHSNLVIRATADGLVRYGRVRNNFVWSKVRVGSLVTDRMVIVQIADVNRMYVRLEIPERYFTFVREGMPVRVKVRSMAHRLLEGHVSEVEFLFHRRRRRDTERGMYSSHESLGETVFYARVEIAEQEGIKLKPGAVADVIFPFEARPPQTEEEVEPVEET